MRLLNNSTSKLDHLITTGKSFSDHSGVGYKGESSGSKIVFVKYGLIDDSVSKPVLKSVATESKSAIKQSVATDKFVSNSRQKQNGKVFVPFCYFCGVNGHIRPRYFTLMNFMKNHYEKTIFLR